MNNGLVFWFTGLSGSGKTTVATGVNRLLESEGYSVLIIDGDDVRRELNTHLGFTEKDIKKNNTLIVDLCRAHRNDYDILLVPVIAPYKSSRKQARAILGDGFFEIYFSADLDTVIKRDVKGLYSKAKRDEIHDLIGYSPGNVYESPQSPDFVVNSGCDSVEKSVAEFHEFIVSKLENIVSRR